MKCDRCHKHQIQIESHHTWCKFMDNSKGNSWKHYPNRFDLCFNCHKALHQKVIIPLLNKKARTLKFNGSEYWLWKKIAKIDQEDAIESVCVETIKFIMEYSNGNS